MSASTISARNCSGVPGSMWLRRTASSHPRDSCLRLARTRCFTGTIAAFVAAPTFLPLASASAPAVCAAVAASAFSWNILVNSAVPFVPPAAIFIYPLLARDHEVLLAHEFHAAILDEAQAIKNPKATDHRTAQTEFSIEARMAVRQPNAWQSASLASGIEAWSSMTVLTKCSPAGSARSPFSL